MSRKTFLTIVSFIAFSIGIFALSLPSTLIDVAKHAQASATADIMARTVGVLLITMGLLNFLVRSHENSPTLRAIFIANIVLQAGILPIDPYAYSIGVFNGLDSFVPNTILHLFLLLGFSYYLRQLNKEVSVSGLHSKEGKQRENNS